MAGGGVRRGGEEGGAVELTNPCPDTVLGQMSICLPKSVKPETVQEAVRNP